MVGEVDMEEKKANDYVTRFIFVRSQIKLLEEELSALENKIFDDEDCLNDSRIKVVQGRTNYELTEEAYLALQSIGVETTYVELRKKKYAEFDQAVQQAVLQNEENYTVKKTKDFIRIK